MRKRALRLLLGAGYVFLLTVLLLYQSGALGRRREWKVAVLGTLFLGIALAVVLMLYLRVRDRMQRQEEERGTEAGDRRTDKKILSCKRMPIRRILWQETGAMRKSMPIF